MKEIWEHRQSTYRQISTITTMSTTQRKSVSERERECVCVSGMLLHY